MIVIEKIKQGVCCFCSGDATVKINGLSFCSSCGDGELLKIAKKCVTNLQEATGKLTVIPKKEPK
jgi:pyruvate/2-oxoacid:ferredoxin oxidoreductase beta subunit